VGSKASCIFVAHPLSEHFAGALGIKNVLNTLRNACRLRTVKMGRLRSLNLTVKNDEKKLFLVLAAESGM
jgi:hypothetical protein